MDTPLQKLMKFVEDTKEVDGYIESWKVINKIEELLPEEREGMQTVYDDGMNEEYEWHINGVKQRDFNDYFTQKYGSTQNK